VSEATFKEQYFGFQWDSAEYQKPWRDAEFLAEVYESDEAPTHEEIASEMGCSAQTVGTWMPDGAQRGGEGLPYEHIAMFSGGYDSLASTHYAMEEYDCDCVLHIDTGTGIDENLEFVKHVCEVFDWPLEIVEPTKTLSEFAKENGFPKAPAHSWIYRYLKEHPLSSFVTDLEADKPTFYTGVRSKESARRMENVEPEPHEHGTGRWMWNPAIPDWSDNEVYAYLVEHGLPRNPVVETIGRSGECFCGAYADRFSELLTLQEHYPEHYEWVANVEEEVQAEIGTDKDTCFWGGGGLSEDQLEELQDADDADDMTMCVDCEGEGHRTLGHDQDPVYETVYLAGPKSGARDPYKWHKNVMAYDETVNWINPFELNDYTSEEAHENAAEICGQDLDAVRNSDVVLLRRIDGYNLCGASIEAAVALENGIPVVVWNDTHTDVPTMLEGTATEVCEERTEAIQSALSYGRKLINDRYNKTVLVK